MNNTLVMSCLAADAIPACASTRVRVWLPLTPDGVRTTKSVDTTPGYALLNKRTTGTIGSNGATSINDPEILGSPPLWRSN